MNLEGCCKSFGAIKINALRFHIPISRNRKPPSPGMTLPPVLTNCVSSKWNKQGRKPIAAKTLESKKVKYSQITSLSAVGSMSDYVRKPVYFCHPMTSISAINSSPDGDSKVKGCAVLDNFQCSGKNTKTINAALIEEPLLGVKSCRVEEKPNKSFLQCSTRKFREFCKRQNYNCTCPTFQKTSKSFKIKKFAKVSKASSLAPIAETEILADRDEMRERLPKLASTKEEEAVKKERKRLSREMVKESVRQSANQGKTAALKALSFIVNASDPKSNRITLPPLERSALHTFTNTWNPDVSVAASKVT